MSDALRSLIASGTKLWLDSIDPELVKAHRALGATGATSNPIIVADLIQSGRFDEAMVEMIRQGRDDKQIAWALTDQLVSAAQEVFLPVWEASNGNDGYVSFELDPLLEDSASTLSLEERIERYVADGIRWSGGHRNRMIKVPATEAGLGALEELAAAGVTLNVTLIFSPRQYEAARDAVWRGAQRRSSLDGFKSVYSIFVSRVDVYTEKNIPNLGAAQGWVGIVNAKRIWANNQRFWDPKSLPLQQEMIFASTGTKKPEDPADKYVAAFAGSDIETNPPATNDAVVNLDRRYQRQVDQLPNAEILAAIDQLLDMDAMEKNLMHEGVLKFADPQKALIELIAKKREALPGV